MALPLDIDFNARRNRIFKIGRGQIRKIFTNGEATSMPAGRAQGAMS